MAKNANAAGGGFGGSSAKGIGLGAIATFSSFAAQRGINKLASYYEATGDTKTAKTLKTAGNVAKNVLGGAATGAMVGSAVPVMGTAVGTAVGAGIGVVGSAFEYLADKAKEAGEALDKISAWYDKLGGISKGVQLRKDMAVVEAGPSAARDEVEKRAKTNKYLAEQWLPVWGQ